MKICIGIISYLPDDKELRSIRIDRLNKTILDCNRLFNLPILIIAQNWNDFTLDYDNVEVDYPEGEAENGDFFEDMYLIMLLNKLYPENKFLFIRNTLNDISDSANDPNSTWYHKQFNKHDIGDRTRAMIKEL